MRFYFMILVCTLLLPGSVLSQKPLLAGDTFPASSFSLLNSDKDSIRLPDPNKKLVLLDLWATNCTVCIASFPKIEKLQEQFKDNVQIILVNPESPDSTRRFFTGKRAPRKKPSLPMISGSAVMDSLVPFDFVPWYIWIDQKGIVRSITDAPNTTAESINFFLTTGVYPTAQLHASAIVDRDYKGQEALDAAIARGAKFYSILGKKLPGWSADGPIAPRNYIQFFSKGSIQGILQDAFMEKDKYNFRAANTISLELDHPEKYKTPKKTSSDYYSWSKDNYYTYSLVIPRERSKDLYRIAQEELQRYFNIQVSIQKRTVESYALVATGQGEYRRNPGTGKQTRSKGYYDFCGKPIKDLLRTIQNAFYKDGFAEPLINATGYTGNIDFPLLASSLFPTVQLDALRKELNKYGLDIVRQYATTDVLVIKENGDK